MCTLTFVPTNDKKIFTFSRDEDVSRKNTIPQNYSVKGKKIFFPKDERKGGTWIATDAELFVCLLNAKHHSEISKNYQNSRGNIVIERFLFENNNIFFENLILRETAPFILVIFNKTEETLAEISWNGIEKKLKNLDIKLPKIWSSSSLYSKDVAELRKVWFQNFLIKKENNAEQIWEFHQEDLSENLEQNILMKRNDGKETTSLSQIKFEEQLCNFQYLDVKTRNKTEEKWSFPDLQLH